MDKMHDFGRNSKKYFKRLFKQEKEKEGNLNLTTRIYEERRPVAWHIENFDQCPLKPGEYHQSPFFCTGFSSSTKWALRIYPKGKATNGKVGLCLYKMPSNAKVSVDINLNIKTPDLNVYKFFEKKNIRMDSEEQGAEINLGTSFLLQKSVVVFCDLTMRYVDEADDVENCTAGSALCPLSADLKEIYSSGKLSDVTLQAGKKEFPAHKAILCARSDVFAAMFDHPMEESHTNNVKIDDVEPSVLSDLLHYVYTGAVDNFTVDKATALFTVADKYCLEDLQKRCVRVMMAKLCVENACQIATLADMHSEQKLKAATNHIIRKYRHLVFERKEWQALIQDRPLLATEILQNVSTDFHSSF